VKVAAPPAATVALSDEEPVPGADVSVKPAVTVKLVDTVAAAKLPLAAWLALRTTVPTPVSVTVEPEIVAGPLTTAYVTVPLEAEVALTENGASPNTCAGIGVKLSVGTVGGAAATVKLVEAVAAAKFPLAAWLALRTTAPPPVSVTVEPEIVAGPLTTAYVTAPLEAEVALIVNGGLPNVFDTIGTKFSEGGSASTAKLADVVAAAKFPLAAWLALRTTIPTPVSVTVEPETVAGPLTTR
jgi:hypothetical protein